MQILNLKTSGKRLSLRKDESGATMIEYSVLVGLITVALVATIVIIGTWLNTQWTALQAAVGA
jgi:pilus assembly protein Flp/PilA